MSALLREMLDYLSLDRALPRSLFRLLLRPGSLTELYLAGKRVPYVPPLRMYLVISVVFFLIFTITPPDVSRTDVYVGGVLVGKPKTGEADDTGSTVQYELQIMQPKEEAGWLSTKLEELVLEGKRERFEQMHPQELVDLVFRGLQRHVKLGLFVFLPLLAMALKLLFLRSGSLYFDHLIFALHFQSFLFLALSLAWMFHRIEVYALTLLVVLPFYLLLALRRVYRQRWRWLVPKFFALGLAYVLLLSLVFGVVMVVVLREI